MSSLRRSLILGSVVTIVAASMIGLSAQAGVPWMGTWKLNVTESKYNPGPPPKSTIAKLEPWENGFKHTIDTVDAQGRATHTETIAKFDDGKDYRTVAAQTADTRAYQRIDDRTLEVVVKTDGKVTTINRWMLSRDGKTLTLDGNITSIKNAQGQIAYNTTIWEKQ